MKALFFLLLLCSACITAPKVDSARIIPNSELEVITRIKEAKSLLASGRSDLAEKELLLVLKTAPNQSSIYNDLGVVKLSQSKFSEAQNMFLKALEISPSNAVAQENYAKALFRNKEYSLSIKEFKNLLSLITSEPKEKIEKASGKSYVDKNIVETYRSISSAYLALGSMQEALSYSNLALMKSPDVYQAGVHSRLLMLNNDLKSSYDLLNNTVIGLNYLVPASMLLDYSINLFNINKINEAQRSIDLALKKSDIGSDDKVLALLSSYLFFISERKLKEANALQENIRENEQEVCNYEVKNSHMPARFLKLLIATQDKLCRKAT